MKTFRMGDTSIGYVIVIREVFFEDEIRNALYVRHSEKDKLEKYRKELLRRGYKEIKNG